MEFIIRMVKMVVLVMRVSNRQMVVAPDLQHRIKTPT